MKKIEYKYKEKKDRIFIDINTLFENIEFDKKIKFKYDLLNFYENCNLMINRIIQLRSNRRFIPLMEIKKDFINTQILKDLREGEKEFRDIFNPKVYSFLVDFGIIDEEHEKSILWEYKLQYTHRFRELARTKLKDLTFFYIDKINFIFNFLFNFFPTLPHNISVLNHTQKQKLEEKIQKFVVNNVLRPCIEKYLFYINYSLKYYFYQKKNLFEIAYEDFYYFELKLNISFLINFMKTDFIFGINNSEVPLNKYRFMNKGGFGYIYEILSSGGKRVLKKSIRKPVIERAFFEFFKHCCIIESFKDIGLKEKIPEVYSFILGKDEIAIEMEKLNGTTLLKSYYQLVNTNNNNLNEKEGIELKNENKLFLERKNNYVKNILLKFGNLVKEYQKINFVHFDLNPRNIMIENDEIKLVDFDFSFVQCNNLFIFNFVKEIDVNSLFQKDKNIIKLTYFTKSIDLFRLTMYFFFLPNYIKKYVEESKHIEDNCFKPSTKFLESMRIQLYGTDNKDIPSEISQFFDTEKILSFNNIDIEIERYFKLNSLSSSYINPLFFKRDNPRTYFPNYFFVREIIFFMIANNIYKNKNKIERTQWIEQNYLWIKKFLPPIFKSTILSLNPSTQNNVNIENNFCKKVNLENNFNLSGGKKKSIKSTKTKSTKTKSTKTKSTKSTKSTKTKSKSKK